MTLNRILAFLVCAVGVFSGSVYASGGQNTLYVPGQLVVQLKGNPTSAEVTAVATKANARVVRALPVHNWYQLEAFDPANTAVTTMQEALAGDPLVTRTTPNYYAHLCATPNDTYWPLLWGLNMIKMPQAWDIQKGAASVRVAVVDTGVRLDHPDLAGRLLPGYDVADNDTDPNPPSDCAKLSWAMHGTHVAGTVGAQGNNGIGVVGVCWDNVKIIPIKIASDSSDSGSFPLTDGILGLEEAGKRGAQVINMSWGAPVPFAPLEAELQSLANAGVILVAAAGNDSGPVLWPAAYDQCIAVSAVNNAGTLASYSNFGPEVDIAAPGGDSGGDGSDLDPFQIVSTAYWCFSGATSPANGYRSTSGTSMASPHVAGAAALLLSNGMPASNVRAALEGSAKAVGGTTPNNQYGYGILDCAAALTFSPVNVLIDRPRQGDVLSAKRPFIRIELAGAAPASVKVLMDEQAIIDSGAVVDGRVENFDYNTITGEMVFTFLLADPPAAGATHRMVVTAAAQSDLSKIKTRSVSFSVKALTLAAGKYLFSRPFASASGNPGTVLGTSSYRMARAVTDVSSAGVTSLSYAFYNYPGLVNDPEASLKPPTVYAAEVNGSLDTLPRGVGYWLDTRGGITLPLTTDFTDDRLSYEMDIISGWNQIGSPYPFPIAWGNVLVTYLGETVPVAQAAAKGWINAALYRYENGAYISESAPNGTLNPWLGYWVKVKVPRSGGAMTSIYDPRGLLTLTFPPLQSGVTTQPLVPVANPIMAGFSSDAAVNYQLSRRRAANSPGADWRMEISVKQDGVGSQGLIIGMASAARDTLDTFDLESPPPPGDPWVTVQHSDWGPDSGFFISDMRNLGGLRQSWDVSVFTYKAGKTTMSWRNLGRASQVYKLVITDLSTGKNLGINQASYHFEAPAGASVRKFRVMAERRAR